jgi:hypothetical protein
MLVTATTWVLLVLIGLGLLGVGWWTRNVLSYGLGTLFIFMLGIMVFINGFAEPVGATVDYNMSGNLTVGETHTTVYEQNRGWWTDFLGVAMTLGALGLFSIMVTEIGDERKRERNSVELGEL